MISLKHYTVTLTSITFERSVLTDIQLYIYCSSTFNTVIYHKVKHWTTDSVIGCWISLKADHNLSKSGTWPNVGRWHNEERHPTTSLQMWFIPALYALFKLNCVTSLEQHRNEIHWWYNCHRHCGWWNRYYWFGLRQRLPTGHQDYEQIKWTVTLLHQSLLTDYRCTGHMNLHHHYHCATFKKIGWFQKGKVQHAGRIEKQSAIGWLKGCLFRGRGVKSQSQPVDAKWLINHNCAVILLNPRCILFAAHSSKSPLCCRAKCVVPPGSTLLALALRDLI